MPIPWLLLVIFIFLSFMSIQLFVSFFMSNYTTVKVSLNMSSNCLPW